MNRSAKQTPCALRGLRLAGPLTERQLHAYERFAADMATRMNVGKLRDILLATGDIDTGRRIWRAVNEVTALDNHSSRVWPEHMIVYLRRGLNRLADFYGDGAA